MRIRSIQTPGHAGTVLFVTLISAGLIGIVLASYLTMTSTSQRLMMRSEAWNSAMGVVEAGVEEAMGHLNENWETGLASQGWGISGTNYVTTRYIGSNYYVAKISVLKPYIIESQGFAHMPLNNSYVSRVVQVQTANTGLFSKVLVAREKVDINGSNVNFDSYDSTDPLASTNGQYDAAKRRDNGDIATNSGDKNMLSVGNAKIRGRIGTGPGGTANLGSQSVVGSLAWHNAGNSGAQPGWTWDDVNIDMPDAELPPVAWLPAPAGGGGYTYILPTGNWKITGTLTTKILVTGQAKLWVDGEIKLNGQDKIDIATNDARLELYTDYKDATFGGNGVNNFSGLATNFFFYGLKGNKDVSLSSSTVIGVVYAPNAEIKMTGGVDVHGAIMCKKIKVSGGADFHYDEALVRHGPNRGFFIKSWKEL